MKYLFAVFILLAVPAARSQSMFEAIRAEWHFYVLVSSTMPRESLVQIARDAQKSRAVIVLRGMGEGQNGMVAARDFAAEINTQCCSRNPPAWMIHPALFDRYKVKSAPAFVVAKGEGTGADDFSLVYGDVGIPAALKFIAQTSRNSATRAQSSSIYTRSFGSKY